MMVTHAIPPRIPELIVISGKGGTGKTSVVASFATLAENAVLADCDVDAADLHLLLSPDIKRLEPFFSGRVAKINGGLCIECGDCLTHCRFGAVLTNGDGDRHSSYSIDPIACEGCGVCVRFCPEEAIAFPERNCGEWFVSETRVGPMVHARLGVAAGNSGKLVATVRAEAQKVAARRGRTLVLVDGPPGVGCPVIASVTGASLVLVVTEPTVSGEHDLDRVISLTRHFKIPAAVCVNKWDVNPSMADAIESKATRLGAFVAGRVRYDERVTSSQVQARAVTEVGGESSGDIRDLWMKLLAIGEQFGVGS